MGAQILWSHVGRVQCLAKKRHTGGRRAVHGQGPPPQDASLLGAERPTVRGGQGEQGVAMRLGGHHISAALVDETHKAFRIGQTGEMAPLRARTRAS